MTDQLVSLDRGTSLLVEIPVKDENGNPFDLTNGSATWWVGKSVNSTGADVVIQKSSPSSGITISSAGPLFTLNISLLPADTENLEPRASYYHEAKVVDQNNNVYVVASGTFELDPALTT